MRYSICLIISTLSLCICLNAHATHIIGGEISYTRVGSLGVCFTIKLYADPTSAADSPTVEFFFGDGTSSVAVRKSGFPKTLEARVLVNEYEICRNYATGGVYRAYVLGENRSGDNLAHVPFVVDISLMLRPDVVVNSSPRFLASPIFNAIPNTEYKHNVGAYDAEGDSLSYELILPLASPNQSGGVFPKDIKINPISGQISWLPKELGVYVVAVRANKWRNGEKIGYIVRDFTIRVVNLNNLDRQFNFTQSNLDFSNANGVVIPNNLSLAQIAMTFNTLEPESKISAFGELLETQKADFNFNVENNQAEFSWEINSNQVRERPYILTFRYLQKGGFHKDSTILLYLGGVPQKFDDIVAGLSRENNWLKSKVFPNPSIEKITIQWVAEYPNTEIQIIDYQGVMVMKKFVENQRFIDIPIQNLRSGVYLYLILKQGILVGRGKFIKK